MAARLILLNGLPGVGKSTLARGYVVTRPGVLDLDIDVLRMMLGGPWEGTAELGRSLALQVIRTHLASGYDVVVPQLVANPDQLRRFEDAATGFGFVHVLVDGRSRSGDAPWQQDLHADELDYYRQRLGRLVSQRSGVHRVDVVDGDPAAAAGVLAQLLGEPSATG